jgi:hypothetical protein
MIAYFHPSQDPALIKAGLLSQGATGVGMRDGSKWRDDYESGFCAVHAPLYPGIVRHYADRGTPSAQILAGDALPAGPSEVDALPAASVYAVVNPGRFLADQLARFPIPAGAQIIAVNEAARRCEASWQLCNDGFADPKFQGALGTPGRITRRRFAHTIGTGPWFALDSIGITEGIFSTTCALRCAAQFAGSRVLLYGHDLTPGKGLDGLTDSWESSTLSSVAAEVSLEIARIRSSGKRLTHYRKNGQRIVAMEKP